MQGSRESRPSGERRRAVDGRARGWPRRREGGIGPEVVCTSTSVGGEQVALAQRRGDRAAMGWWGRCERGEVL